MEVKELAAALLERFLAPELFSDMNRGDIDWQAAWRAMHEEMDEGDAPAAFVEALRIISGDDNG